MVKITLGIEGMMCGMCEAHINDAIRKSFKVNKVKSSAKKNTTEIIVDEVIPEEEIAACINPTGYKLLTYQVEDYVKKGLFSK